MTDMFFYGTLCHQPLLDRVLGHAVPVEPAELDGHEVLWSSEGPWPVIRQGAGCARGMLLRGASAEDVARLDFYEGGFGYTTAHLAVRGAVGPAQALVYLPPGGAPVADPWCLADWVRDWGAIAVATAGDFMALYGQVPAEVLVRRYRQMLVRGASRLRAAVAAPATLRHEAGPGDVVVEHFRQPYAHFFAVEEYDLRHRRFDGTMGARINRAVFLSGDAVTVLPYDPLRDRVLLVEQFRAGPYGRGDPQPWLLEPIAGRVDPDETPEAAARREAMEEAGLRLGTLEKVADYYPSPGAKSEYLYSYVAVCDLPDGVTGLFGVEAEAEDIRSHLVTFDQLMALVARGEVNNAPLLITAFWLQRERMRLRWG
jgi:nudix-type nucleoside diphosphatase (YffH/AdpP family)